MTPVCAEIAVKQKTALSPMFVN